MANNAAKNHQYGVIAKGLNSPEIRSNSTIPYVDENVELELVKDEEKINPKGFKDVEREGTGMLPIMENKIHASDLGSVHTPNSDTIVVNTPEGTLYITLDPDSKSSKPTSPSTESTDLSDSSPTTSKAIGAQESSDMIVAEKEKEQRREGLRRNSISMPTLQNLESEVLKQHYSANPEEGVR
ncbi:unnamed protein product [Parnassius apollo]|uniref:(apollo) hypothetical protein n=1 Tax=Parnassius apollo TaxID=110799 RepID=A0A8S3YG08_PARAO|nr:unnamed protein product [Parnassius apollo]